MNCARTRRRRPRGLAGAVSATARLRLGFFFLLIAALTRALPSEAQPVNGTDSGGAAAGGLGTGGAGLSGVGPGAPAPDILPPTPSGPYGLPNPLTPPNALPNGITLPQPQQSPYSLALPVPGAGISTLQQYDPNTPAVLIQPYVTVGELFTDNALYTSSNRTAAAETRLLPGVSISADTPRLKGVLTGSFEGDVYTPTSELDQVFGNLYAGGTGTVIPDRLFVDANSVITQASPLAGLGFVNPTLLPRTQQTQVYANTVSPYLRESIDGLVDTELRYRFGATNYGGNTTAAAPTVTPGSSTLASGILNEGTFTAATGQNFVRGLSRLTVDASNFNSASTSRNSQFSSYDDLEYRFTPNISALGRIGYQNLQYPFAPAATFAGLTWLAGGRVGLNGYNKGFLSLEYGRQQGVYGFTGEASFNVTPTLNVNANLVQGISNPSEYLQSSLATSTLNPFGSIVDQYSNLPTAFYNPGLGLTNGVYRQHLFNLGVNDAIGINTYSLYGFYDTETGLTQQINTTTKSVGANFTWQRAIRPDLNGNASLGYTNSTNVVTVNSFVPVNNISTWTANLGFNYLLTRDLTGSVFYTFSYQPNGGAVVSSGGSGSVVVNSLQFLLTKAF